jgi:hypothetical protein
VRTGVCHCTFCQRRTGSAFGANAYFNDRDVAFNGGARKSYEHRSDESGRWLRMEFCPNCGSTVSWTLELSPGLRGIAVGTFDDPKWIYYQRHTWTRSAHPWVTLPPDIEIHLKSAPQQPIPRSE